MVDVDAEFRHPIHSHCGINCQHDSNCRYDLFTRKAGPSTIRGMPLEQIFIGSATAVLCLAGLRSNAWLLEHTRKGRRLVDCFGTVRAVWILRVLFAAGALVSLARAEDSGTLDAEIPNRANVSGAISRPRELDTLRFSRGWGGRGERYRRRDSAVKAGASPVTDDPLVSLQCLNYLDLRSYFEPARPGRIFVADLTISNKYRLTRIDERRIIAASFRGGSFSTRFMEWRWMRHF